MGVGGLYENLGVLGELCSVSGVQGWGEAVICAHGSVRVPGGGGEAAI